MMTSSYAARAGRAFARPLRVPVATIATSIAVLAGMLPLIAVIPAPLADWPSHLARVWITGQVLDANPFWSERYHIHSLLIPNAILDAVTLVGMRLGLTIDQAGLVFLLLCYSAFMFGFIRLSRACGNSGLVAAACGSTFFYTGVVLLGLLNYMAGVAGLLIAYSLWCRPGIGLTRRFLIACIATPAVMFCHIVAALALGGVLGCHDLFHPARRWRDRLLNLAPATLSLLITVTGYTLSAAADDQTHAIGYRNGPTLLGILKGKVHVVLEALTSGQQIADVLGAVLVGAVVVLAWRTRARIGLRVFAPAAALVLVALLAPDSVGNGSELDFRLCIVPLMLAAATFPWSGSLRPEIALSFAIGAAARTAVLAAAWAGYAAIYADIDRQFALLNAESTLLAAYGDDEPSFYQRLQPPLWNGASLAVRHGVFVPSVYASPTQQPLAVDPKWRPDWLWSHYANGTESARLKAAEARGRLFCRIDPKTALFILNARAETIARNPGLLHAPAGSPVSLIELCQR